jgi:hypothetical protein
MQIFVKTREFYPAPRSALIATCHQGDGEAADLRATTF